MSPKNHEKRFSVGDVVRIMGNGQQTKFVNSSVERDTSSDHYRQMATHSMLRGVAFKAANRSTIEGHSVFAGDTSVAGEACCVVVVGDHGGVWKRSAQIGRDCVKVEFGSGGCGNKHLVRPTEGFYDTAVTEANDV
ncbi:hypothetical protein [Rubripirellula tenax]|nr:hypothetical protein [Rubripirellula tenax]